MDGQKKKFEDIRKPLEQMGFQTIKSVGKGAFGEVILVRNKNENKLFAVKVISKLQIKKKPFLQKYIDQEIEIMKKLEHSNIVQHEHSFSTHDFIVIIMEYCEQGNLLTYQARLTGRVFSLDHAIEVVVEVMKGLKCIHENNFIHRDIKSENVLLKRVPIANNGFKIEYKIADFGFARSIGGIGAKTHCGTEKYMAPEILSNSYYGISVDLWAVGVLLYFMLFAEYPFKGQDMRADIQKKCTPSFSLGHVIAKKDKLKDVTPEVEDFFKKIFVIDSKKRITFSNIIRHPLFSKYACEFEKNIDFYNEHEKKEKFRKDEVEKNPDYGFESDMEAEDDTRTFMLKKKEICNGVKHLERQLEEINFEIRKVIYLKECAMELYQNYYSYLKIAERLAARFYLLKAFLFYCDPLLHNLQCKKMPQSLSHANIDAKTWQQCTKTENYRSFVIKLQEQQLKSQFAFEDTYVLIQNMIHDMPIRNFEQGYTLDINQKKFDELKKSYRSTTSYIFKIIQDNRTIDSHLQNKIKMRLFCCHMINRIFQRADIAKNFPYFIDWLKRNKISYPHTFDFVYFKRWILEEEQERLSENIQYLHKIFF